ncbi:LADA_0G02190g1_1 [Lachancea dasiensis]|uniref:LADA_0G02190g1_1 n=1 Tax=Lachancea dasiensis TaxID=1072105 RepID=A0A1G4JR23_9SACH|nr:LADA_0G02190g1_1 [Lachancea dasiensis]
MSADKMDLDEPPVTQDSEQIVPKASDPQSEGSGEPRKKKFEVKKWTAVAFWSWDIAVENCAICRNHIMEPCIQCQPTAMTDCETECVAAWGVCSHAFHLHCINKWLQTRNVCPLDNQPWQFAKYGR